MGSENSTFGVVPLPSRVCKGRFRRSTEHKERSRNELNKKFKKRFSLKLVQKRTNL